MASFIDILSRFEGPADFARRVEVGTEAAKQIFKRKSIPAPYWREIAGAGVATLDELAEAAAQKRQEQSAA
jgi:hypothetical protein